MPLLKKFEEIEAWQEARELTQLVYRLTKKEAFRKDFGLVDQIRRSSVSIMNNIVEGFDNHSSAEFIKFLGYAKRSGSEVQGCLYVALDEDYISEFEFKKTYELAERTRSLIAGFIRYLQRDRTPSPGTTLKT